MPNCHNQEVPTYELAKELEEEGRDDVLSRFVVNYTPASEEDEQEFYKQLQSVIDHVIVFIRVVPYRGGDNS